MNTENPKNKSLPFASGLIVGTAVTAAAAFLYKTQSGKKVKKMLGGYYSEAKDYLDQVISDVKKQAKTKTIPEAVDSVVQKEVKAVKKKIKAIRKNVFSKKGKPLVK